MTHWARARWRVGAVLTAGVLLASVHAAAAADAPPVAGPRVVLSASGGMTRPADRLVRQLYGASGLTFRIDGEIRARGMLGVFIGARFASWSGETVPLAPKVLDEAYPIELASRSMNAGALLTRPISDRLRWFVGAGLAVGSFEERWPALGDVASGTSLGVVGLGGIHCDLTGRFGLVGRVDLSSLTARRRAADGRRPNLGGLEASLGASARF